MRKRPTRIVFVLSQLVQHGSERFLFEICQALDKEQFEVEVLTRKYFVKRHYYYSKLRELGIPVHTKLISRRHLRYLIKRIYRKSVFVQKVISRLHSALIEREYDRFFDSFDVIAVIGIETYCDALRPLLDANRNVIIHHVSHEFQFERDYFAECPQDKIVTLDVQQEDEIRRSRLSRAEMFRFAVSMNLSSRGKVPPPRLITGEPIRIGVVSRLFRDRPNEPIFRCFAALLQEMTAILYFYGGGDKAQYDALLEELGIQDKVRFMGHQEDLEIAIRRDNLALLWLVSMGPSLSYASIEVASLGMPMVFWNLSSMSYEEILAETDNALHSFSNIDRFVEFNRNVLADSSELATLGEKLRTFVRRKFEIANYIKALEHYYQEVAERASLNA
jgi:glycosyltransferase involved in cell wall biosynthesis